MDEKEQSGGTVRVAGWLLDELDEVIRQIPRGQRPTKGQLLEQAWLAKAISNGSQPPQTIESSTAATKKSEKVIVNSVTIGPGEKRDRAESWENYGEAHAALDYILQRGPKGMAEDILGNIRWFEFAARVATGDAAPGEVPQLAAAIDSIESRIERAREVKRRDLGGHGDTERAKSGKGSPKKKIG